MIPTRSEYAGQSYRLFTDYNEIHVFVEDSGFENLYAELFKRSGLNVRKVFSKNGKASVVEAARCCTDSRCVYVVDRDWDDFFGITYSLSNLVILEKYSIENYFIEYAGFRALVLADNPRSDVETLLSSGRFDSIVKSVSDALRPLFECYLAMQALQDNRPNCGIKPGRFQTKDKSCFPDANQIETFVAGIGLATPKTVSEYFAGDVMRDRGHGKYMLHFVWTGVRDASGVGQLGHDALLMRLAQTVDTQAFSGLCNKIARTAKKRSQQDKSSVPAGARR